MSMIVHERQVGSQSNVQVDQNPKTKWPKKIIDKKLVDEFIFSLPTFAWLVGKPK